MTGVIVIVSVNVWFVRKYLNLEDEEEYGGILTLLQEGAFPAVATFVVRRKLHTAFAPRPHSAFAALL